MTEVEQRLPSALYCDLFYANPGAEEFRRDYVHVWLLASLCGREPLDASGLLARLLNQFPGLVVDLHDLVALLEEMVNNSHLATRGSGFVLTPKSERRVSQAKERYDASKGRFLQAVLNHVSEALEHSLSEDEEAAISECTADLVMRVMIAEREALEILFDQIKDFAHVPRAAARRASQLETCLEARLPDSLSTRRRELRTEVLGGIGGAIEAGRAYLLTLNRSVVSSFFLIRDPHHVENIRQQATARTYFLDTNVYLAWMYESSPSHGTVRTLLGALKEHGARLRVLPETVSEISRIEMAVERLLPRAMGDSTFAKFLVDSRKAIFTDYWHARHADKNLSFSTFSDLYMNPAKTLPRLGVEVEEVTFDATEDFSDQIATFRNAIRGVKEDRRRVVSQDAVEHDAKALVQIAKLQLRGDRDEWGSNVQFLTLDRALEDAVEEARNALHKRFETPANPLSLARLYLPTAGPKLKLEDYEDFIVASVRESLGLLDEVSGYGSVALVDKLDQAGIPTKTLLAAPRELLEPALSQLQGRKDLNRRLDQALATPIAERKALVTELQRDLEEAISVGSEFLREAEARVAEEAAVRSELEGRVVRLDQQFEEVQLSFDQQSLDLEGERAATDALRHSLRNWTGVAIGLAIILFVVVLTAIGLLLL